MDELSQHNFIWKICGLMIKSGHLWVWTKSMHLHIPISLPKGINSSSLDHHSWELSTYWRIMCLWAWRCTSLACPSSFAKPVRVVEKYMDSFWLDVVINQISNKTYTGAVASCAPSRAIRPNPLISWQSSTTFDKVIPWRFDGIFFLNFSFFFQKVFLP